MDNTTLAHTSWECKYHIVFAPKYRRQVIYGKLRIDIGKIVRELCERKGIEIIETECCPDHVHMLIRIPPKYSVLLWSYIPTINYEILSYKQDEWQKENTKEEYRLYSWNHDIYITVLKEKFTKNIEGGSI